MPCCGFPVQIWQQLHYIQQRCCSGAHDNIAAHHFREWGQLSSSSPSPFAMQELLLHTPGVTPSSQLPTHVLDWQRPVKPVLAVVAKPVPVLLHSGYRQRAVLPNVSPLTLQGSSSGSVRVFPSATSHTGSQHTFQFCVNECMWQDETRESSMGKRGARYAPAGGGRVCTQ